MAIHAICVVTCLGFIPMPKMRISPYSTTLHILKRATHWIVRDLTCARHFLNWVITYLLLPESPPTTLAVQHHANKILSIPEIENGDLANDLDSLAALEIRKFVNKGGGLIIFGSEDGNVNGSTASSILNKIFVFDIMDGGFAQIGNSTLNSVDATGTAFEGGPSFIPNLITTNFFMNSLPTNTRMVYGIIGESSVVIIPYGGRKNSVSGLVVVWRRSGTDAG